MPYSVGCFIYSKVLTEQTLELLFYPLPGPDIDNFSQTRLCHNDNSFADFPFDLFKLTREQKISMQKISIKNLISLDKISAESKEKVCNICQKDIGNFKSMRAHQTFMHFKILRQYRDQYGKLFENFLSDIIFFRLFLGF